MTEPNIPSDVENRLIVTVDGRVRFIPIEDIGVAPENVSSITDREILEAAEGYLQNEEGSAISLVDGDSEFSYAVRRDVTSNNLLVYPKSPAGC